MADETENTEETAPETEAADAPVEEAPAAAEPEVLLTPKEARAKRRAVASEKRGGPRRPSTPEARAAERARKAKSRTALPRPGQGQEG